MKQKAWLDFWDKCAKEKENPIEAVQYLDGDRPLTKKEYQEVIDLAHNYLKIRSNNTILEVGCGCGLILNELISTAPSVVGIDYSEQMILKARKLFPTIPFLVGEADHIPFPSNYFNRTFCFSIFAYFPDLDYAVRSIIEFTRVTAPGGRILLGDIIKPLNSNNRPWMRKKISHLANYRRVIARMLKKPPPLNTLTIEPGFIEKVLKNHDIHSFQIIMRENPPYSLQETRYDVIAQL